MSPLYKLDDPGISDRWLIVGLGNPGKEYEQTRHNVGFMAVEKLAKDYGISGKGETKFNAIVGVGRIGSQPVVLAQPLTYMNLSGEATSKLLAFYKIPAEHMLVIYDDAALPFGKLRVRGSGSSGGQNGMKSIIKHLGGSEQFPRLRIGIGEGTHAPLRDHVLSKFSKDEQPHLENVLYAAGKAVETILHEGVEPAMTRYNGLNLLE